MMREPFFPALSLRLPAPSQGPGNLQDGHYSTPPESSWSSEGCTCLMDEMMEASAQTLAPGRRQKDDGYPSPPSAAGTL